MIEKEFIRLIKKNSYQVFLFSSLCPFPLNFALHYWFVINKKGRIDRWEILAFPNQCKTSWRHLHKNVASPIRGLNKIFYKRNPRFQSKLVWQISGKKNSLAYKMIKLIDKSPKEYSFCNKYFLFGPNSNSYVKWALNKFPEAKFKMSLRAIGKGYNFYKN